MTPEQLARARKRLGLTLDQMALMLGYEGEQAKSQVHHLETGRRDLRPAQRRLVDAYLAGYRPKDWPENINWRPGHMSLDVTLLEVRKVAIYDANITHNLGEMAEAAGIYRHLWRPEEIGITKASELIEPLREGLAKLEADPEKFKAHNSPNGWGMYEHFVPFVRGYLAACEANPDAEIDVSR